MQARHVSTALLTLGLLVGIAAGVGLVVGFEPARLPAALLNIAAYKLTFLAAGGLLAAGAIVARYARRSEARPSVAGTERAPAQLQPNVETLSAVPRERVSNPTEHR